MVRYKSKSNNLPDPQLNMATARLDISSLRTSNFSPSVQDMYKNSSKWHKTCLAQLRPISKTAPAYKESRSKTSNKWYKVIPASKQCEIKTPSKLDVVKFSSSLCQMYPRLQYLMYMKSQPPGGHNPA